MSMCKRCQRAWSGCSHRGAGRREDSVPDLPQRSSHVPDGDFHGEDLTEGLKTTGHVPDVPYGAGHPALGSPKQRVEDSHRRTGGSTASRSWTLSGQSLLCRKHHRGGDGVQAGANMIGHGIRQATAEGLALGVKAGVEREAL